MTKKNGLDREMILGYGLAAILSACSIIFAVLLFFGWDISECDSTKLVTAFSVLAGGIWGILLCRNC